MRAKLISIGNSKGVRLPRAVIEQVGLSDEVELEVKKGRLIIRPATQPREGWEEAFKKAGAPRTDAIIDEPEVGAESEWDRTEWTW